MHTATQHASTLRRLSATRSLNIQGILLTDMIVSVSILAESSTFYDYSLSWIIMPYALHCVRNQPRGRDGYTQGSYNDLSVFSYGNRILKIKRELYVCI